jgi:hypothetical protein
MFLPPGTAWNTEARSTYSGMRQRVVKQVRAATAAAAAAASSENSADADAGAAHYTSMMQEVALPLGCPLGVITRTYAAPSSSSSFPSSSSSTTNNINNNNLRSSSSSSADRGITLSAAEDCGTGEIWCWAQCESVSAYNLTCPYSEVQCITPAGDLADPDEHDPSNQPGCVGVPIADPGGFCYGSGTSMYMEGFVTYLSGKYDQYNGNRGKTPQCLTLLFNSWVLDSKGTLWLSSRFVCIFM